MDDLHLEEQRNLDKALRAIVILEVGCHQPCLFTKNNRNLDSRVALQSTDLVRDLLKLGLASMNFPILDLEQSDNQPGIRFDRVPSFILGMAVHYAIAVAPTVNEQGEPTVRDPLLRPIIDLDLLNNHVARIEQHLGIIPVDDDLITRVSKLATARLNAPGFSLEG